jgi:hypothetical protein
VTITGRVIPPLGRPIRRIEVRRRVSCAGGSSSSASARRARALPHDDRGPPSRKAATYRFATRVRASARGDSRKTFETYTLPRFVDLGLARRRA